MALTDREDHYACEGNGGGEGVAVPPVRLDHRGRRQRRPGGAALDERVGELRVGWCGRLIVWRQARDLICFRGADVGTGIGEPQVKLGNIGEHAAAAAARNAMHGEFPGRFPSADGTYILLEERSDFLPGVQSFLNCA